MNRTILNLAVLATLVIIVAPVAYSEEILQLSANGRLQLDVRQEQSEVPPMPDFNGDGTPDYFAIEHPNTAVEFEPIRQDGQPSNSTCLKVAISEGNGQLREYHRYCGNGKITTYNAPSRAIIKGRWPWAIRLTPHLTVPGVGVLPTVRDGVLLEVGGVQQVLLFTNDHFVLHQGINVKRAVYLEALEALSRFETQS